MERESRTLEYKRDITNLRKLAQTVVAFANGDGGRIIIGVDDRTRAVAGLAPDKVEELLEKIPVSLADQIQPPVFPHLYEKSIDDKEALIVQVFPANLRPCFIAAEGIERGVYIRVGAHTRRARGEVLEELRLLRRHVMYDEAPMPECPFSELNASSLPVSLRSEKALHALGVFRHDSVTGGKTPLRGAVLMLHPNPERYVPEAYVVVSRMRGDRGRHTIETQDLTGSAAHQADAAVATLERWLGKNPARSGARYLDEKWILPPDAVREAVVNAVFHRQYSIPGPIKIALYATRLEVFNPGHFAGPFVSDALGDGTSYIRNRVMCMIARRMGLMEKRGTGIRLIMDAMRNANMAPPIFEEGAQWFKVILPLVQSERKSAMNDPEDAVMDLFETVAEISSGDVCRRLGVSKATAVGILKRLIQEGGIARVGSGPRTRYVLT